MRVRSPPNTAGWTIGGTGGHKNLEEDAFVSDMAATDMEQGRVKTQPLGWDTVRLYAHRPAADTDGSHGHNQSRQA